MEKEFVFSLIVLLFYGTFKFVEMKYIEREWKSLKLLVRDIVMVFASSFIGAIIFVRYHQSFSNFFSVITDNVMLDTTNTKVYTDMPSF
jgi:hypothetical protein|tara:strand:+ start:2824 stop:3090 length:267 start_codon:yes stop_codon:yes gene_type:complete